MKWIWAIGRAVRDSWLIAGACLLLLILLNATLDAILSDYHQATVIDGASAPGKWSAEFFQDQPWVNDYRDEFKASRKLRWTPYAYWRRAPYQGAFINVDESGARRSWRADNADREPLQIWVFGGSTIWGSGARDDHTIPSALARELSARGVQADVINFGERGWVLGQEIAYLQKLLSDGRRPDLVVFYDGANDVFADGLQQANGGPQNEANRRVEFRSASNLLQWIRAGLNQMEGITKLVARLTGQSREYPPLEEQAGKIVERYQIRYGQVQALARQSGFQSLMVWQPVIFSRQTLSEFEQQVVNGALQYHRDLHLQTTSLLSSSALRSERGFLNLASLLDRTKEPVYMDFCHVSEAANQIVAEALANSITPLLRTTEG